MERKSVSIADQIFEKLEQDILGGEYTRGELLTEIKLSEQMGVSRTPVREALRRLEQEHIIEMSTRGAVVVGISAQDIDLIYEIRMRIEGLAVRLAAQNAVKEDIERLRKTVELQEFYTKKGDAENIRNADSEFHRLLYRMSASAALCDTLTDLHKKILKYRSVSVSKRSRAKSSLSEHRAIFDAIAHGDAPLAERLTVEHIANARNNVKEPQLQ